MGHQPGSSNTTQSYSPSAGTAPIAVCTQTKKGFVRAKGGEPGSPLLRRALSPDRLHPRSAENKCSISPLCSSGSSPPVKTQARSGNSTVWRPISQPEKDKAVIVESDVQVPSVQQQQQNVEVSSNSSDNRLSLNLSGPGELLPRIAEEKDSPTNTVQETEKDKKCDKENPNKIKTIHHHQQQKDNKKDKRCDRNLEGCNKHGQDQTTTKKEKCDKTGESSKTDLKKHNNSDNKSQSICDHPSTKNVKNK